MLNVNTYACVSMMCVFVSTVCLCVRARLYSYLHARL